MANAKIKKIKLGTTTYDLCDADAIHAVKQDGISGASVTRYGSCTTAAATAAKTASITTGGFNLETGVRVTVKFSSKNTANNPTLNINGSGAKNIFHNGARITTGGNKALLYGTVDFVYDGTQWQLIGNYVDTNTHNSHTLSSGTKADGTTEIVGASSSSKLTLGASGVTQGAYGPTATEVATVSGTIKVPEITVNDKGIVTAAAEHSVNLPSVSISNKSASDTTDLVYAVSNLVESGINGHTITPTYSGLPTKAYVDKVATGHVKYLGTATAITSLATTAGQGDFYRVSTAFTFGSETAHVGDILLATKDNPAQNTTDWDLIHTEINTNTWTANTKANAGYVAAGGTNANTVWKTDASGNPAWGKLGEACLAWGGQHISGGISPVGASLSAEHSANRLAYLNPAALVFESSDNAGSTWTTLSWSNENKVKHVTTSENLYIGAAPTVTTSHRSRMTITAQNGSLNPAYVYTRPRKLLINMSTNGHGVAVTVEYKTGTSGAAWQTLCTQNLSGWSGWNEIDVSAIPHLGGGSSQTSNVWYWRLTYKVTSVNSNDTYKAARPYIIGLRLFGETCWARTSNMGETGHLYSYDWQQNATFPANVSAAEFIENGTSLASKYTNVQADWSETTTSSAAYIKNKPAINNATLTLNVGGQTVSGNNTFTANDATNTTYNVPSATASAYGVVKVSSVNTSAVTVNSESTTAGRYYPVELNSDGKAIVNVPWTYTNTTYTLATGDANGQIKVTPSSGSAYNVSVKGLGSSAYETTYKESECTTFTSDSGNCTPAAVQKGAKQFAAEGPLTGYSKASTAAAVAATDTIKVAIGKLEKSLEQASTAANTADTDATVKLATDLYAYTAIGKITNASNTNPVLVASKGSTLKAVFNKVFGEQTDTQPTITTSGVSLGVSPGTTSYGGGEYGATVAATTVTVTFTLNNSATAQYGYRCGSTKTTTSNASFKYAITKQSSADIKITLPSGKTASSSMVTAGTFVSASSNVLYCNFNSSNKVSIQISLPAGSVSTSSQTRYGQISASVILGAAQTSSGTTITKFLTYLGNDATNTTALSSGTQSNTAGAYTISAGSYYSYSKLATTTTAPTSGATRQSSADCDNTYSYSSGQYLWLYSRSSGKKIQTYVAGSWADVTTSGGTSMTLTLSSGGTATYYAYRTDKFTATGSARYRLA